MSSASLPWPLLYFFLPLPILAGQPSMGLMPTAVAQTIPLCAQTCVQSFIANDFPTSICSSPQDLNCLCTQNGIFGFTLGEGSLRCVVTSCSDVDSRQYVQEENKAYEICVTIPNAKPMTHGTLTATKSSNPTDSFSIRTSSSHRSSSSSSRPSRISSRSSRSQTHSSSAVPRRTSQVTSTTVSTSRSTDMATSRSVTPRSATSRSATSRSATSRSSASSSVLSSSVAATQSSTIDSTSSTSFPTASATQTSILPVAGPAPALSKGQIAGVAVGSSVAALAFAGILFFVLRRRRRRSNRRDSGSTFGGDRIFGASNPGSPALYQPIVGQFEPNSRSRDSTQLESQEEQVSPIGVYRSPASPWRGSGQPEIGLALAPDMTPKPAMAESPRSFKSSRTASRPSSRLLPDKPAYHSYSLYPPPLRINHSVSPESPGGGVVPGAAGVGQRGAMPLSKAAPRGRLSSDTSQVSLQRDLSIRQSSSSDPFLGPRYDPDFTAYARQRSQNPQSEILSSRPSPEVLNRGQWTQSLDNLRKPVPARQSSSARTLTRQQSTKASISPSDYTGRPMFELPPQPTLIPRKPVPKRKSAPRRPATHYSSASDTSFEDAGDEDAIPTANPILSPVQESPATRSHRRQVTDPNILRSFSSPSERRPEPESPTRQPTRRRQPPTLATSAAAPRPLKSSLKTKPLPKVPEIPDSSTPLIPKMRGGQISCRAGTDSRGNPRGETELTAKWKILVSPGLQPIENSGTPRSGRSSEWNPSTPTRRDA